MALLVTLFHCGDTLKEATTKFKVTHADDFYKVLPRVADTINGKPIDEDVMLNSGYVTRNNINPTKFRYYRRPGCVGDIFLSKKCVREDKKNPGNYLFLGSVIAEHLGIDPIPGYVWVNAW